MLNDESDTVQLKLSGKRKQNLKFNARFFDLCCFIRKR